MNQHTRTHNEEPIVQTVSEPLQKILKEAAQLPAGGKPGDRGDQTAPYRPTNRQPLAALTILDDGSREEGETLRIRQSSFQIGREKGDLTIPFDRDISSLHAELRCHFQKGRYRWYLTDLTSTNGTFLRAYRATLARDHEILLGSRWYRFQLPPEDAQPAEAATALETNRYQAPARTQLEHEVASLTEQGLPEGESRTFHLGGGDVLLGRESGCQICIPDDKYLSPEHALFSLDKKGRWLIEDRKSLNGIWIRIRRMPLEQQAEFQLGQQRFCFRPQVS